MPNSVLIDPSFKTWAGLMQPLMDSFSILEEEFTRDFLVQLRQEVWSAAHNFSTSIGLEPGNLKYDSRPIVMSGHQPVLYHPGLLLKAKMLKRAAEELDCNGINIIIDLDQGTAPYLLFPIVRNNQKELQTIQLTSGSGLYINNTIRAVDALLSEYDRFSGEVFSRQRPAVIDFIKRLKNWEGRSAVSALTFLRHQAINDMMTLELPISQLLGLPSIKKIVKSLIDRARELVPSYNATLEHYRQLNNIKNLANPFPNMKVLENQQELPFWLVDTGSGERSELFLKADHTIIAASTGELADINTCLAEGDQQSAVATRGMLTTFILRYFCSDFFIHGLGGASYDKATDMFFSSFASGKKPSYAIVTENRYLFSEELEQYESLQNSLKRERELYNHPELAVALIQAPELSVQLKELIDKQQIIRERLLAQKKARESVSEVQKEMNAIRLEIRKFLDQNVFGNWKVQRDALALEEGVIKCREFPYFFFDLKDGASS